MRLYFLLFIFSLFYSNEPFAQAYMVAEDFAPHRTYFTLTDDHQIDAQGQAFLQKVIGNNQFIGLAEVHQSQQLSYFTVGLLDVLQRNGFGHFALEIGPYSAEVLQAASAEPNLTSKHLRDLNHTYGKKAFPKIPIVFVDKIADALFVQRASELGFKFWGLDQEFAYSYEMHLDSLYALIKPMNEETHDLYIQSKEILRKAIFKSKIQGITKNCWLRAEPTINAFLEKCKGTAKADGMVAALRTSWDIYCKNETSLPSNQIRADYMKSNFDSLYHIASSEGDSLAKVFVKMGGVHLTHGKSIFGVHDIGEHLSNLAEDNHTGFLSIRHLSMFHNGKNLIGKSGWEGLELLMSLGSKEQWTLVDLRPLRKKLEMGELKADPKVSFDIYNYDLLLIPPDDSDAISNY